MKIILRHLNCWAASEFPGCSTTFLLVQQQVWYVHGMHQCRFIGKSIVLRQSQSEAQPLQDHTWDFQDMRGGCEYAKHLAFVGNKNKLEVLWSRRKKKRDATQPNRSNHIYLSLERTGSNNAEWDVTSKTLFSESSQYCPSRGLHDRRVINSSGISPFLG